jgi:hypothetical protein
MPELPDVPAQLEFSHPHDLLARHFLVDRELFASLLENYGDNSGIIRLLDAGSLRCETPSSIDSNLQEVIGDLRFSAKLKDGNNSAIFFFFEHQSKKENFYCLHCLRKLLEFYEACKSDRQWKGKKYPYPTAVILYHGKIPWKKLRQMGDLIHVPDWGDRKLLSFPVILIDLSQISSKDFKGHPALIALLDTLQSASFGKLPENLDRIIGYFEKVKSDFRINDWINSISRYTLTVTKTTKEIVVRAISKILNKQEAEKMVMSTMKKNFMQGKLEGKLEGKREEKIQAILTVLKKNFRDVPESVLQSVNSYKDIIALSSLFELALNCETLQEFEQGLAH